MWLDHCEQEGGSSEIRRGVGRTRPHKQLGRLLKETTGEKPVACMELALKSSIRNSFLISNMRTGPQIFLWNHKEQVTSLWQTFKQIEDCMVLPLRVLCPFLPLPLSLLSSFFFWLHQVFIAMHGLSLVVPIGSSSLLVVGRLLTAAASLVELRSRCTGFSTCCTRAQ